MMELKIGAGKVKYELSGEVKLATGLISENGDTVIVRSGNGETRLPKNKCIIYLDGVST